MTQLSQMGIGVVVNEDFLKSLPARKASAAGAVSVPEKDKAHEVSNSLPKVLICLCICLGQHYLAEQMDSCEGKAKSNWEVWALDDGAEGGTHVLEAYQQKWAMNRPSIRFGPDEGFAIRFVFLICKASIEAYYYAYSDQDVL